MKLDDFRKQIPQLNGLDDQTALDLLHKHYYPSVDKGRMAEVLGVKAPEMPAPERSTMQAIGDTALSFGSGAVSGVRMMSDLAGADNVVSRTLRNADDAIRELQSATAKHDQQRIAEIMKEAEDKGFVDQVVAAGRAFAVAPGQMMAQAAGTAVPTVATALIPGVGPMAAAARAGMAGVMGAAQGAGNIKGSIYEEVKAAPLAGETPEQTEQRAVAAQSYRGPNVDQIAAGGALGALAGSTGMERAVAGLRHGVSSAAPGLAARVGMGAVTEAIPEMAQGGQEKFATNLALGREGLDVDHLQGVVGNAALEGMAGAGMGAVTGMPRPAERPAGPLSRAATVAPPPEAPPPMPEPGHAQALRDHANNRARELDEKANGTKDEKIKGPDGKDTVVPGRMKEFLTPEEKKEREFLSEHGGDAAALAQAYPGIQPSHTLTGTDSAALMQPPENPLMDAARAGATDREQDALTQKAMASMERQAARDQHSMREFDRPPVAEVEPLPAHQPGDVLNPKGQPFKTEMAARRAAKAKPGEVVAVEGGFVVRPAPVQDLLGEEPAEQSKADGKLPRDLAGAKPRYNYGSKAFELAFDSDLDRAAFVIAQEKTSSRDADYLKFVMDGTGLDEAGARAFGRQVRDGIKAQAKDADPGVLNVARAAQPAAETPEWQTFPPETGTLGLPRAEMPQIKSEHRGAMVNFLNARGVTHEADEVDPGTLKPTQAEYSEAKVGKAQGFDGPDRSILVSADGYVLDGHHQWLAKGVSGQPVKVIRLKAPIADLLPLVREFPSSTVDESTANVSNEPAAAENPAAEAPPIETPAPAGSDGAAAAPVPDEGRASADQAPGVTPAPAKKPPFAKKDDLDHLFGVDKKRQAAIDRIAKGTAYFGTARKAEDFIAKSGLKDTHEVVKHESGANRWDVRAKASAVAPQDAAPAPEKAIDRRKRLIEERRAEAKEKPGPYARWRDASFADRREMLRAAGYTDTDQNRVLSGTDWSQLTDPVRNALSAGAAPVASPSNSTEEKPKGIVGRRADGVMIREDDKGVRWYAKDGVRIFETVTMRPTRDGLKADRGVLKAEFMTAEEQYESLVAQWNDASHRYKVADDAGKAFIKPAMDSIDAEIKKLGRASLSNAKMDIAAASEKTAAEEGLRFQKMAQGTRMRPSEHAEAKGFYWEKTGPDEWTGRGDWFQNGKVRSSAEMGASGLVEVKASPVASANTIFTEDAAEKARAVLKRKLGTLNSGIDPELMQAGLTLAGYHIEKGARTFAAFARAMVADLGEGVKPYLKSWYLGISFDPRAQAFTGLDDVASVAGASLDAALGDNGSSVNEKSPDGVSMVADLLGDGPQRQSLIEKGFEGVGVDVQQSVLAQMRRGLLDLNVRRAVVEALPRDVMRMLIPREIPTALLLRNETVFADALTVAREAPVPVPVVGVVDALVAFVEREGALPAAKVESPGGDLRRPPVGTGSALGADDGGQGNTSKNAQSTLVQSDPHVDNLAQPADTGDEGNGNAAQQLDRPSEGAPQGAPAEAVRAPESERDAGAASDRSRAGDVGRDAQPDESGRDVGRGVGDDARAVPVPARGTRAKRRDAAERGVSGDARGESGLGEPGRAGGLTPEEGANPAPNAPSIAAPQPTADDFTITDELALGEGGQKTKFKNNVAAIRLVRELEDSARMATPDEQAVLAKYVGWGGLPQAFDSKNADWAKEHAEITALMSPEELDAARRSTRYAHYTSREIVQDGIYAAMRHFGFTGGKTLEAGAGVGNFIGLMPADMRSAGRFTAIEREPFSSAIARHLYPRQNVQRADFTEFKGSDGYFDAAVGNPPFASDPQTDRSGRKHLSGLSLHNYFFAKSVDMLREGGIMAQVVTNAFLDAKGDKARKYISDRVEFLGAIRLPNNAFAKNANTEVTTDLIFLRKRPDSEIGSKAARADAKRWLDIGTYTDARGRRVALNQYFIDNPHMMLGDFGAYGTMYGPDQPALVAKDGQDTLAMLRDAVGKLPANVYKSASEVNTNALIEATAVALRNPPVQEGGYFVDGDKLMQRLPDVAGEALGVEVTPQTRWTEKTSLGEAGFARIKALAEMRVTVRGLIAAEMKDADGDMKALRARLNEQYDAYAKNHGLINDPSTLRVFEDDPDFPLLASLEHGYTPGIGPAAAKSMGIKPQKSAAKKGPIFTQRVVAARQSVQKVDSPADAIGVSMAERGRLDTAYIGQLLGMPPENVLRELSTGEKPLLFRDPETDEYVLRDAYLSGNVRAKLAQARAAALFDNVKALEEVQPEDVPSHEISARLGAPWVPTQIYGDFAHALFGEESSARVTYLRENSSYSVMVTGASDVAMHNTWGTKDYPGDALLQAVMNNRTIKVTYRDSEGKTHTDIKATEDANTKAAELRERFNDWLFSDPDRSEVLTKAYNETNNNYVTRVYDGAHMTFPGKVPDSIIKFRRHQRNAIARIVQDRTALLDHVVGAGKTFTVIAGAMELKRTGLARKPMVAVPNHLVKQWAADFYRLYPGANILTATKKDFERANRRKFLAKIATGDWDAVVIAHSSFGFIKPSPEFESEFNAREIRKIMAAIDEVQSGDEDKQSKRRTVKQLEGMKERLENRIKALRDKPMDDLLDFEQLGVDQLFVDEAHLFKNLMYTTKMQGVSGLNDPTGSQRAYDMYLKTNQIMEKNGRGQGVVFATGTPVSNSLAEMYHMMRYLMPEQMRALGFESFDAWANTYAGVDQVWMQAPSGDGFKAQNRMSNFVNTPELLKLFDQVSDTVTMDDIKKAFSEENKGAEFPLPKVKGGRRSPVSLDKSPAQDAYMADIARRAKILEQRKGPPKKGDDNILVVMGDARKAAMDIRLVDHAVTEREKGGRIDRATDEIIARYKRFNAVKGTQLVFSDLGTPIKHAKKELVEYQKLQERIGAATEDVRTSATLGNEAAMATVEDAEAAQAELDAMGSDWLSAAKAAERGFSVYDDIKAALIEKGIPEGEIAFIHDFNTDEQKSGLFRKVNAGQIRVVLGSTAKMGAGTNVQERLVALHHLDVPWRPSDVEQREGRIERQGNKLMTELPNFEVEILAYVTKDTLDMRMWQVQETKLKMINQLRTRKVSREIDNAFEDMELSAGEMQAAATGDINLLKEIQLRAEVKKLEQRRRSFEGQKNDLLSRKKRNAEALRDLPDQLAAAEEEAKHAAAYLEDARNNRPAFKMNIDGKDYTNAEEAQAVLRAKDEATEEHKALNGEVTTKKAPLSVTINGEHVKNRATMGEMFSEARGDTDAFAWTFNGETYRRRSKLANGIRAKVMDAIADERAQEVGTIGAYTVAVEGTTNKAGETYLEVTLSRDGEVRLSNSFVVSDSNAAAQRLIIVAENMLSGAMSEANYLSRRLKSAQRESADLDGVAVVGEWPDQAKLDAARAEHKAILAQLKQKDGAGGGSDAAPAESLSIDAGGAPNDTEVHGPAPQAHRDAVAALNASFAERVEGGSDENLLDAVAPGSGNRGRSADTVSSIARRIFGREVVYVRFRGEPKFNGAISRAVPGYIFINIDAQKDRPYLAILGHELLHQMAKDQPGIYKSLSNRLDKVIKNDMTYGLRTVAAYKKAGISLKGLDTREELEADIVGDNFTDPLFWEALAKDQPGLFKRVANFIIKWLDNVIARIGKVRPFGTEEFLTDVEEARAAVADAMRQFSSASVGAVADPVDGPEAADLSLSVIGDVPNDPRPLREQARDVVSDILNAPGKLGLWHKTVGTQYNLAQRSLPFKRVYDRVQDFLNDVSYHATQAADLAPNILPKLDTWRDIFRSPVSAADNKAIAAPIFEGTLAWRRDEAGNPVRMSEAEAAAGDLTVEQKAQRLLRGGHVTEQTLKMWRGLPIEQYEKIIEGKFETEMLAAGVVWSDAELVDIFKLTPAQISLYREFRAATDKSLATLAVSDMVRFGGNDVAAMAEEAMNAPDANVAAIMLRDHLLDRAELEPGRRDVLIDTANKMVEKADRVQSLMDRGYAPLSRFGHYSLDVVDAEGQRVYFGLFESRAEAGKMARAMRANFPDAQITQGTMSQEAYKLFAGVSPETLELFGGMLGLESGGDGAKDRVFQEYLKLAKGNRSAMKRLIERKGIAGFSEDAGRVLAGFIYSNARQTAAGLHMGAMAEAASDISNQQGELKDAALKLVDYIKNPVEEAAQLRGLLFAQYLGGSVASAMVNMTQPVAVTMPFLSQYGGVRAAAREMTAALADVFKKSTGDTRLDTALKHAEDLGIVAPQEVHQLMAQARGKGTLKSGDGTVAGDLKAKASNALSKGMLAWGKAFGAAEQFNRRVTFIAAYRLAVKQGMKNPAAFAEKAINETQFVYNKGNKPRWARGAVGGTIFTFKQYSISYVELLTRMAARGPEGRKAALLAVGVLFLMSGAGGLPFLEDLEDLIDGFMQRVMGYNFSSKQKRKEFFADLFGKELGDFMEQGVSGLPGAPIDVSGRLGLGNLIPGTGLLLKKTDYSRDMVDAVGPAGDLIRRGFQAGGHLLGGNVGKAAEVISPVAARNLTKAVDMANTGLYRDEKGRKVLDVDAYDVVAKSIGFQPSDVARVQEGTFAAQRMISLNKITETEIADRWAMGVFEKNPEKVAAARQAMLDWNRRNPESPIRINMGQILKRVRAMRQSKESRIAATAPREIRANVRRELMASD